METNTDKNSLNFVSDYSSVSLIKSSFFHIKVTNTRFRLVRGNYHVPAIWHNQLVHYSAISLQSNISNATLVDTCFMMLDNLLLFFFRHLSSSISSKSFHFFFWDSAHIIHIMQSLWIGVWLYICCSYKIACVLHCCNKTTLTCCVSAILNLVLTEFSRELWYLQIGFSW